MVYGISGPHIEGFREGWAIMPFVGGHCKPHYWRRKDLTHEYTSLCGMETDQSRFHPGARRQFAPGVFMVDRCKRCSKKHAAHV
jgi:hypothetical protein